MFSELDRQIFGPYWNGSAQVYADPIAVRRRFQAVLGGDANAVLRAFRSRNPAESIPAGERLAAAVCAAFGLGSPFDPATGAGVVEAVWKPCLESWLKWLDEKKKQFRELSDAAAAFGSLPPATWTDYGVFVGFWLNVSRARLSKRPTGRSAAYWDAIALDEAEALSMAANAACREAEAAVLAGRR